MARLHAQRVERGAGLLCPSNIHQNLTLLPASDEPGPSCGAPAQPGNLCAAWTIPLAWLRNRGYKKPTMGHPERNPATWSRSPTMSTTRTGPSVGRSAPDAPASSDMTAARPPTPAERADVEALLTSPAMRRRLRRDHSQLVRMSIDPTPETAAARLARLALRQASYWDDTPLDLNVPHPRFNEAVEAAAAADKDTALEAATSILQGPEAAAAFGLKP